MIPTQAGALIIKQGWRLKRMLWWYSQKMLDDMADELQELLTRSEVLGEQGDVDGSQAAAAQAEAVKVATQHC